MTMSADRRSIVVERVVPGTREAVWRALTDPSLIARWLMANDFEPTVGHRFHFRAEPMHGWNGVTDCEVLVVEPMSRLSYRWNASGDQAEHGLKSTVTWTLETVANGTRIRMEQTGFRPEDEAGHRAMSGGWPHIVEKLGAVAS